MFTNISLKNFKPFGSSQAARLAPLTLIYGPNSSGKSSIIQALLLLQQSAQTQNNPAGGPLNPAGPGHDFGTIRAMVYKQKANQSFGLGISFLDAPPSWLRQDHDPDFASVSMEFRTNQDTKDNFNTNQHWMTGVTYGFTATGGETNHIGLKQRRTRNPEPSPYEHYVETDSSTLAPLVPTGAFNLTDMESAVALIRHLLETHENRRFLIPESMRMNPDDAPTRQNLLEDSIHRVISDEDLDLLISFLASQLKQSEWGSSGETLLPRLFYLRDNIQKTLPGERSYPSSWERHLVDEAVTDFFGEIEHQFQRAIGRLVHLGPLRFPASRDLAFASDRAVTNVGKLGNQSREVFFHAPKTAQDRINGWLRKLDLDYRVSVEMLSDLTRGDAFYLTLRKRGNDPVRRTTDDVGFGVSQILPVIIQGVISEDRSICVEQPEIHLHPRLQANLGDFLIDTAKRRSGNQWIVETHSELLIQRIQRRVREGVIPHRDVSVLYVDPGHPSGSVINELRLDPSGRFIDEWPQGFFNESFEELMALNEIGSPNVIGEI